MTARCWQATYSALATACESIGSYRVMEAHAKHWHEANVKLPKYLYPAGRRYRRISGPTQKEPTP